MNREQARDAIQVSWPARVFDLLDHLAWRSRHPSVRRCPRCKMTWEPRAVLKMQDGVCHDCFDPWSEEATSSDQVELGRRAVNELDASCLHRAAEGKPDAEEEIVRVVLAAVQPSDDPVREAAREVMRLAPAGSWAWTKALRALRAALSADEEASDG